jgi:hypothetical protein
VSAHEPTAFISYSRDDSEFAQRLATDLEAAGAKVWLDREEPKPDRFLDNAVEPALNEAAQVLVVLSPNAVKSGNVRDEFLYALKLGKIVIPLLYADCILPPGLELKKPIDFRADYARGVRQLLEFLKVANALVAKAKTAKLLSAADSDLLETLLGQTNSAGAAAFLPEAEAQRKRALELAAERKAAEELEISRRLAAEREARERAVRSAIEALAARRMEAEREGTPTRQMLLEPRARTASDPPRRITMDYGTIVSGTLIGGSVVPNRGELPESPKPADEDVEFTIYRPQSVPPEAWKTLLAFAHRSSRSRDASRDELDPLKEVQQQAEAILGKQIGQYRNVSQDSAHAIPREGSITFLPEIEGVEFQPRSQSFTWQGRVHPAVFLLSAGKQSLGKTLRGQICVFLGNIIVAQVQLSVRVENAAAVEEPAYVSQEAPWYRRIFASYSHKDLAIVEEFERHAIAFGDDYLRDFTKLRAGAKWNEGLRRMIHDADVFQLFWSSNSMNSDYVHEEYRYALSLARESFVRPVYWEQPLPASKERNLPPPELREIHFHRIAPSIREGQSRPPTEGAAALLDFAPEPGRRSASTGAIQGQWVRASRTHAPRAQVNMPSPPAAERPPVRLETSPPASSRTIHRGRAIFATASALGIVAGIAGLGYVCMAPVAAPPAAIEPLRREISMRADRDGMVNGCHGGNLVLNGPNLSFTCPPPNESNSVTLTAAQVKRIDRNGIEVLSGEKYRFRVDDMSGEDLENLFKNWVSQADATRAAGQN